MVNRHGYVRKRGVRNIINVLDRSRAESLDAVISSVGQKLRHDRLRPLVMQR